MASTNVQTFLFLVVFSFMFSVSLANFNYTWGPGNWNKTNFPYGNNHPNSTQSSNKFILGGSENWHYGFDYMDWARKNGPLFVNDTLVGLQRAKRIANPNQGACEGFEFVLEKMQPHYFACGEHESIYCNNGTMKFVVMPLKHWPF